MRRLATALGRLLGRRPAGLMVLDPDADADTDADVVPGAHAPLTATRSGDVSDRTRPIDTNDLLDVGTDRRARIAAPHKPAPHPPAPHRPASQPLAARRTGSTPAQRIAAAAAELGPGEYEPLDALITALIMAGDDPPAAATTDAEQAWLRGLLPLVEYELMAQGGTAVSCQRTADQLGELVALTDTDFNAAVRLVSRDPAIAAAILSAANSVERTRGRPIGDLRTAVARLGLADTRRIAIAIATRALHDPDGPAAGSHHRQRAERDLHRAMTCAFANAAWAARDGVVGGEDPFVAGMFADVGRPLVHRAIRALERRGRVEPVPPAALTLVIEHSHVAIGADALAAWGLPHRFAELARYHRAPVPPAALDGADLQRLALVGSLVVTRVGERAPLAAARRATAALALDRVELRTLALEIHELAHRVSDLFGVHDAPTTWDPPGPR